MAKARVYLKGQTPNKEGLLLFKRILVEQGSRHLLLVEKEKEATLVVEIDEIDFVCDIAEEAKFVIESAMKVASYEKKRNRIIKDFRKKALLATTRKHIN